ncbi:MAG TPA: N-acetyl-gamma-glutamyl-phosphate reductase [Acidimicrobiia bacterium]|jgi:N-acetyl-gamma-glutamyl-phosphate reductase
MSATAAVLGASGFAGGELVRLLDSHPQFDLVYLGAGSRAGERLDVVHPQLTGGSRILEPVDPERLAGIDVVFVALPHGESAGIAVRMAELGCKVLDLGSDLRLDSPARYEEAYGEPHPLPFALGEWSYGLPELFDLGESGRVASPGCYPTAVLLAVAPLVSAGLVSGTVIANALSGVTGAGRAARNDLMFGSVAEGMKAYGVAGHRHRPEMEMALERLSGHSAQVVFIPHLIPINRGLLATVTVQGAAGLDRTTVIETLEKAYAGRPWVEVIDLPPQTRWTVGSNRALVSAFVDRTGQVISICALDNLLKGAAGQAVQSANILFGLPEEQGLPDAGILP